ncbi:uncharacterized protein LOC129544631 [Moschus berezovskii]|uniref:uncharacterized protein LOC129544631 n=1 Tax=Moschus berezovskii TaxID=68408 RepID=UPI002444036E|nr:uncharacterized protein LOC129544631 [Moschus berezovskii]XP_055264361.1 uncharacterized protein LOC129544631 [Moschus berezovskii]
MLMLSLFLWARLCPLMYPKSFIILLFIFRSVTRMTISPSMLRAVLISTCCLRMIIHSILFHSIMKCPDWRVNYIIRLSIQFSSVAQSCLTLCEPMNCSTPGFPVHHQLLELTPKLTSIESVMPSSHLILCRPLLLPLSVFPSIRVFSNRSVLCIRWPKYWSFSFSNSPSNEYSGLISFRMDWLDLLAVQGTLKSLLQHHSSKASILWCSAFFIVRLSYSSYYLLTITFCIWCEAGVLFCFVSYEYAKRPRHLLLPRTSVTPLQHCFWYKSRAECAWIFFWSFSAVLGTCLLCASVTLSLSLKLQVIWKCRWSPLDLPPECLGSSRPFPFPYMF